VAVQDALDRGLEMDAVIVCALECVADGIFDDQSAYEGNPIVTKLTARKSTQGTPEAELEAWEKVALRNGKKAVGRFEARLLPQAVEDQVRDGLQTAQGDRAAVRAVFSAAKQALTQYEPTATTADDLAAWAEGIDDEGDDDLRSRLGDLTA
jgi:hypothetical protein